MKIKCSQSNLVNALQIVQTASSTKSSLVILSNVLLECTPGSIRFTTTDLEIGISCEIPAECSGTFSITVPAKRLFGLVKEFPGENLEFEIMDNNVLKIKQDKSSYKINCMPDKEFPKFPTFDGASKVSIPGETLKDIINKTSYSICRDEGRYVLTGLYMSFTQTGVISVATDGRRLSFVEKKHEFSEGLDKIIIVPFKAINEISKLINKDEDVDVSIQENQVLLDFGKCRLFSRLIDGHFPNYKQVIPEGNIIKIDIEREVLFRALKRISLLTTDVSNQVKIVLESNTITLEVSNSECGEAKEEIPIKYTGDKLEIAFNPVFLLDVLRSLDSETVTMELSNPARPGVVRNGSEFIYVIMPMRIA